MSCSSFYPAVPCTGAALSSAGSLGLVPLPPRSYCGTPTPRDSSSSTFLFSVDGTRLSARSRGASQVPGDPQCVLALFSDPGAVTGRAVAPNCAPARHFCLLILQSHRPIPTEFRGSVARLSHSLSTLRSRDCSRTTQDSLPAGGQPSPDERARRVQKGTQHEVSLSSWHPPHPGFPWRTAMPCCAAAVQ
jgi:hypothetical protein